MSDTNTRSDCVIFASKCNRFHINTFAFAFCSFVYFGRNSGAFSTFFHILLVCQKYLISYFYLLVLLSSAEWVELFETGKQQITRISVLMLLLTVWVL